MDEAVRVHGQAMRSVFHAAQQLAVLTCDPAMTEQQKAHFQQLSKLIAYAREAAMLAFDSQGRPQSPSSALRSVCLHCGEPYEAVDADA